MTQADEIIKTCDECGAAVYPDHLEKGTAGKVDEKLLCPICFREYQRQNTRNDPEETIALVEEAEVPVTLDDDKPEAKPKITAFGDDSVFGHVVDHNDAKYQRPLVNTGRSAIRCRTFHTKLTDAALSYMDSIINEWIDKNPQIEIKFATSSIGMFEAKRQEPHLIVTVFY
jgi:hypothetical protein